MKFIIPIFVGAIIGYITNWLAIKMLFRPYEKKYIFGIGLPFTPGLIPKEQKRIAKSVGDTVGAYLLSEDVIVNNIKDIRLEDRLDDFLRREYNKLSTRKLNLEEVFDYMNLDSQEIKKLLSEDILDLVERKLEKESNSKKLEEVLSNIVDGLDYDRGVDQLLNFLEEHIERLEDSKRLDYIVRKELVKFKSDLKNDQRYLREIVDEESLDKIIYENSDIVVEFMKDCIDDFAIAEKVKDLLNTAIEKNMGRTLRMFISPDTISEKIYTIVEDFIYSDDFKLKIKPVLASLSSRIMDYRVDEVVVRLEPYLDDRDIDKLASFIVRNLVYNRKEEIKVLIKDELDLGEDLIKINIKKFLKRTYRKTLKDKEFRACLYRIIHKNLSDLFKMDLVALILKIDSSYIDKLIEEIKLMSVKIINDKLPKLVSLFNISKIVEDEINKFEVDFAEEVILEIASKELKAITWLGALLGAIMGIISPILQMI